MTNPLPTPPLEPSAPMWAKEAAHELSDWVCQHDDTRTSHDEPRYAAIITRHAAKERAELAGLLEEAEIAVDALVEISENLKAPQKNIRFFRGVADRLRTALAKLKGGTP